MTKRKSNPLRSAWKDETLTGGKPLSGFAAAEVARLHAEAEQARHRELVEWIRNQPHEIDPEPVIAVIRYQLGEWRLYSRWREQEPQVSQWRSLIEAIRVPDAMTFRDVDRVRREVNALPVHVLAVFTSQVFTRFGTGPAPLFERMMAEAAKPGGAADGAPLRCVLQDMVEGLSGIKGRRGPKANPSRPYFRAVVQAIRENARLPVPLGAARELAAELLSSFGMKLPRDPKELVRLDKPRVK